MNRKLSALFLIVFGIAFCSSQDVFDKSDSKSSSLSKISKKPTLSKPSALLLKKESVESSDSSKTETIPISDLGITVPPEDVNDTIKTDHHTYYNVTFYSSSDNAKKFWINLDNMPEEFVVKNDKLSDSHRQATTVELSFDFPFYGNPLRNITIATGGFLYMGDYLHNWIAATQYVAPLMANFDTRLSQESNIKYADNGTAFIVLWENVHIRNRQNDGAFTFQATLLKSGDIIFAYKNIPYAVSNISDSEHPVKVGLSDAYILERAIFFVRRKTVYEYNRIHVTRWDISNDTALYFTALPTCNTYKSCSACLSNQIKLDCNWCEAVNRCSDGIDRLRQNWVTSGCLDKKVAECPATETIYTDGKTSEKSDNSDVTIFTKGDILNKPSTTSKPGSDEYTVESNSRTNEIFDNNQNAHFLHGEETSRASASGVSAGAIATILIFLAAITAVGVWVFYAYKYPQSSSGQFLIKYRPSQWALKKDSTIPSSNSRHL